MAASEERIPGTITWEDFLTSAKRLAAISAGLNDGWMVRTLKDIEEPDSFYLEKRTLTAIDVDSQDNGMDDCEESISSDRSTVNELPKQFLTYEYHVVYSIAYCTPVLYFTAWTQDGHRLPIEAIWDKMCTSHHPLSMDLKWSTLTQQIHPVFKRPYYQLHPCRTADLMKHAPTIPNDAVDCAFNYLICWLSIVGNIVGLTVSVEYAKTLKHL